LNDITLLDSWVISVQGHFTKSTDLFPQKISNSLNGCPMKVVVRKGHWCFTTKYFHYYDSNGNIKTYINELLKVVYDQMNKTSVHVPTPEGFQFENGSVNNLLVDMFAKVTYISLGALGTTHYTDPFFDFAVTSSTFAEYFAL
jgi:hypothetical protein